jgi:nitric oxide reductase
MVESLFTKKHIEDMQPHIQQTVDSLLDTMVKEGCGEPVDIVEKFALPVPSYVRLCSTDLF